jgi:hypothetical protein
MIVPYTEVAWSASCLSSVRRWVTGWPSCGPDGQYDRRRSREAIRPFAASPGVRAMPLLQRDKKRERQSVRNGSPLPLVPPRLTEAWS